MNGIKFSTASNSFHQTLVFQPWVYFGIFLASNILLSYFSLSSRQKLWVGLLGVVLPLGLGLWSVLEKRLKTTPAPDPSREFFNLNGFLAFRALWPWFLFGALLILTRFFRLTSLPFWPLSDEGIFSSLAADFSRNGRGDLLWTEGRIEPLLIWSLGLFFRVKEPSLAAIRLYPALLSLGSVFLSYWAARKYFPRPFSLVFCVLFSFSFWEFTLMRFCTPEDLIPLFQFLALGCLGLFLRPPGEPSQKLALLALTACNAAGFYSYINWAAVWIFLSLVLALHSFQIGKKGLFYFLFFQASSALLVLPLALARLQPGNLSYIQGTAGSLFSPASWVSYFTGLFWDSRDSFPFAPNWGGMLDPVTGSLVFIGVIYSAGRLPKTWLGLLAGGIIFSMLPGTLSNFLELHRITPSLPFWIFLAACGAQSLLASPGPRKIFPLWAVILAGPLVLNGYNFTGPYMDTQRIPSSRQWRSIEYWDAFQTLDRLRRQEGPLLVFSEFNTDYDNKTLNTACYPFDALQNPALAQSRPKWAALILNSNYTPSLLKFFPGMKFLILKTDKKNPGDPHPFSLFMIPISDISPSRLAGWIKADHFYREANLNLKNRISTQSWDLSAQALAPAGDLGRGDPLLTAVYWEKTGFFKFLGGRFYEAREAFQNAITRGIPAAQLYYNLGVCLKIMGQTGEAEKNLKRAEKLSAGFK